MSGANPFITFVSVDALSEIVKNLERRWGLTLVSFVPPKAQQEIIQLQSQLLARIDGGTRQYLELYQPESLHLTHLTLTRSNPQGPVSVDALVKPQHDLYELFDLIHAVASEIGPITVELDRCAVTYDGLGVILLGRCSDDVSLTHRRQLLERLNEALPAAFNVSRRHWDTDSAKYGDVHCSVAFLKRPIPQGYDAFRDGVKGARVDPIAFSLKEITLVHHQYRTLATPQAGSFSFPLGEKIRAARREFVQRINLV